MKHNRLVLAQCFLERLLFMGEKWWSVKDSNLDLLGYEPRALTICTNAP